MYVTNISEAKAQLSALLEKMLAGEEVIIGKAGRPVAKLVRYERSEKPRRPGPLKGRIK
jgi:prevent-host-death family protein